MVKIIKKNKRETKNDDQEKDKNLPPEEQVSSNFSKNFDDNFNKFKAYLKDSDDIVFRQFTSFISNIKCGVIFVDGMVDKSLIQLHIIQPIMWGGALLEEQKVQDVKKEQAAALIVERIISVAELKEAEDIDKAMLPLLSGETILLIDGYDKAIVIGTRHLESRGVEEPPTEAVVRGPRDGFTETIRFNTALLRRRIRDPNFVMRNMTLGRRTKTNVVLCYIKGIAQPELVDKIEKKIKDIDTDDIHEAGQIEQYIEDNKLSPFPQIQNTERPDKAATALMEGRVVILVDGSPFALILPANLYQFFQSPEDYYERWIIGSLLRSLRWIGSLLATFAPALYIAVVSYHPEMLPTTLALSVAADRELVPFPAIIEALLMEITIELLREAGARLPKPIGQTIGIVGGIIIGDAAVRAGITSPSMVVVVSITAIASFIIPSYSVAIAFRVFRFFSMFLAGILGLYGVCIAFILINIHLVILKSFGVNYMAPVAPVQLRDWKDVILRLPIQYMKRRPEYINPVDIDRYEQDPVKEM
ncbi:MAG: spore germination protein [Clostridiaceae bacterium]|nr:spore germination protein [Clostridiaceae bacterium]